MKKKIKSIRLKDIEVYEHLEHHLHNTTYTHRLQWLKEANDFVNMIEERRKKGTLFVR